MRRSGGIAGVVMAMLIGIGIVVHDFQDGVDFRLRDPKIPVWVGVHSTESYGKGALDIREEHREKGWPDAGYINLTDWKGEIEWMSDPTEITYGIAGKNSQVMSFAFLGSAQKKAWTFLAVKTQRENISANAEAMVDQGGNVLGIIAHRDFAKTTNPTDCPGHIGYAQGVVDGLFSHIKKEGVIIQNPYFIGGMMKGTWIYDYLIDTGRVKP